MRNDLFRLTFIAFFVLHTFLIFGNGVADNYSGTAYPDGTPHPVPGTVEAEDFDDGGEGVAYHDQAGRQNGSGQIYRTTDVDVQSHGTNLYNIGSTNSGEWTKYTIRATEAGTYRIDVYCVSGSNNGKFHIEIDGKPVSRIVNTPNGAWSDYTKATSIEGVQLTEGVHIFTWYTYGGMNIDRFVFAKTGDWTGNDLAGNFNYPITKKMKNPLFVDFDSPMYNAQTIGPLYTADPSAHVWADGRLYVYASHDMDPPQGCDRMDRYHVFSTDDMENWTDHGEIVNASQVYWGLPEGGFMFAPDCAYNPDNETYYFYFPHPTTSETSKTWKIGIATSKQPAANFVVQGYIEGIEPLIDPCVFVDTDGQPYLYHGGGGRCMGGKLMKNDWTKVDGTMQDMQGLAGFHEATWVHKYNGKYYLSHSDGHSVDGNQLKYAVSDNPLGPWTDMGVYIYGTGVDTNHGSIVEYKGKWYAFYHTANYSGRGSLRSVSVDVLEYNDDGSIQIVQNFGTPYLQTIRTVTETSNTSDIALTLEAEDFNDGGDHYAYFDKDTANTGNNQTCRPTEAVDISTSGSATYVRTTKGEWMRYTITVQQTALYDIDCTVSSNQNNTRFHLSVNGTNLSGALIATGTLTEWKTVTAKNILLKAGQQYLDVRVEDGDFNLDKFQFRKAEPYQGAAYTNGNHQAPGTIEAEDYDTGGMGVAYFENPWGNDAADVNSGKAYRLDEGVDLQESSGNIHISHSSGGEWVKYTINVVQAGIYDVKTFVSTGSGSAEISLTFDHIHEYPYMSANTGGYNNTAILTTSGVPLTEGIHILTLNFVNGGTNVDKFIFERKADLAIEKTNHRVRTRAYPNPSNGQFVINIPQPATVLITNVNGKTIYENNLPPASHTMDITKYPPGIYFISIAMNDDIQHLKHLKQ